MALQALCSEFSPPLLSIASPHSRAGPAAPALPDRRSRPDTHDSFGLGKLRLGRSRPATRGWPVLVPRIRGGVRL